MERISIKTKELFEELFPIASNTLTAIANDMKKNGYDYCSPITIWKGKNICIDGHTRLMAADVAGITEIPAFSKEFKDENEALQHAIHNQRDRRNMTNSDLYRCVEIVDKRNQKTDNLKQNQSSEAQGCASRDQKKSAEETARIVGTSTRQVEKIRTIKDHADDKTKADIKDSKKSINKAYNETQQKRARVPKGNPVSDAMKYANMAIGQLKRILDDDLKKQEALDHVVKWVADNR